jgi:hypothetical protein
VQEVGFPTRNEVEGGRRPVCTSAARKIGVPLVARQGRSPSAGLVSLALRGAHELLLLSGRALHGRNGPLRRVSADRQCDRRLEGSISPSTRSICFRSDSFSNAVEEPNRAKMGEDASRAYNSRKWRTDLCVLA